VFHQNSKYRDFVTGLVPVVGSKAASGGTTFAIVAGTLYRANQHALTKDGASLLVIDEINRGPAVQIFGGSVVAIEADKRLRPDGTSHDHTQFFDIAHPDTGQLLEYALSHHLYILAAMNQADTSVEPLDVAFLRRWAPFQLEPDPAVLRSYFGVRSVLESKVAESPTTVDDIYALAMRAWAAVNQRIRLGRGPEFQIGHGVLMTRGIVAAKLDDALDDVAESWQLIRAHIDEVFFGDTRGVAAVLNVGEVEGHPYSLVESSFAEEPRLELVGPRSVSRVNIVSVLKAVAG